MLFIKSFSLSVAGFAASAGSLAWVGCIRQTPDTTAVNQNDDEKAAPRGILDRLFSGGVNEPPLPNRYEELGGCQKMDVLWDRIMKSRQEKLPEFTKVDLPGMAFNFLRTKMDIESDQAPKGYRKAIHAVGTVAKVRYSSAEGHNLGGLFADTDVCGLLRLSLTSKPPDVAPGLALKLFVDGLPSANISGLVALDGQGDNYNFFANEMTNIVDSSKKLSGKFSSVLFSAVSKHPRKLGVARFAKHGKDGRPSENRRYPYQIYFVPSDSATKLFPSDSANRDILEDLVTLVPASLDGSQGVIYEFWAQDSTAKGSQGRTKLGTIKLESQMVSSSYGDSALFFKHDRFEGE
jgi:hypothetical protein